MCSSDLTTLQQFISGDNLARRSSGRDSWRGTETAEILHEIAEKVHRRSLIILFTDMFDDSGDPDEIFKALQHLRHNKHEVLIFHVYDGDTESAFQFEDRPHEFIDLETGERVKLNPSEIREGLVRNLTAFHQSIEMKCHQLKTDLVRADITKGFEQILQAYLIKRARMR